MREREREKGERIIAIGICKILKFEAYKLLIIFQPNKIEPTIYHTKIKNKVFRNQKNK